MEQDRAVNKVLRDLVQFKLVKKDDEEQVRQHLNRLYVAGRSKKGLPIINGGKQVVCFDRNWNKIVDYHNCEEASRELGVYISTIYRSIKYKRLTRKGHYWKYKEATPDSSLIT